MADWLKRRLPGLTDLEVIGIHAAKGAGFSAETFFLDLHYHDAGKAKTRSLVLRRQLVADGLFMNADLGVQGSVMTALAKQSRVRVPRVVGVESDPSILGAPFLVMDKVEGRMVPQTPNYNKSGWLKDLPPARRFEVWRNAIEAMSEVHGVDRRNDFDCLAPGSRGEAGLTSYLDWVAQWLRWSLRGRSHPVAESVIEYLRRDQPKDSSVGVLWGDATPANTLFGDDLSVRALLDWEMAALGPGEVDLGWWLYFDELFGAGMGVERLAGLPDRDDTIALYESLAGRVVGDMHYYEVLANLRMTIITMRAVDRQVGFGRLKATNDAWINNRNTASLARRMGFPETPVSADYREFLALMLPS